MTGIVVVLAVAGVAFVVWRSTRGKGTRESTWTTVGHDLAELKALGRNFPTEKAQRAAWAVLHPDEPYPDTPPPKGQPNPALLLYEALWAAKRVDIPSEKLKAS